MSLIFELAKVDRKAALIFNREIKLKMKRDQLNFSGKVKNPPVENVLDLLDCFCWRKTRQGRDFWDNIFDKVNEVGI